MGIVGVGNMGSIHAGYMDSVAHCKLTAICDVDAKKLESVGNKVPNARRFATCDEMLESGEIDAVLIATPHYDHPPIAVDAFRRGIHVLCEKPVAVTVGAARELNDAYEQFAQKNPTLKFGVMFNQRTRPVYRKMRELIAEGELGEITRITWLITDWFRTWTYYASGGWRATWAGEGGGVLLNQCPHNLDLIHWIVGGMMPKRVTGIATIAKTHPIEVEDDVTAILEYENGAVGHFITTTGELPGTNRLEIVGDKGRLVAEGSELQLRTVRGGGTKHLLRTSPDLFPSIEKWDTEIPIKKTPEGHKVVTEDFVRSIVKDTPLMSPGVEGVKGLEIGNAMLMAGLTRTPVELPMDAEAYDAFLKDLTERYGGKKSLASRDGTPADMAASFG
jgi:predicted dehydrogenase